MKKCLTISKVAIFLAFVLALASVPVRGGEISDAGKIFPPIHKLISESTVDIGEINSLFCTKLVRAESHRLGFVAYKSVRVGCGYPVEKIELDVPIDAGRNIENFLTLSLDGSTCVTRRIFALNFSGEVSGLIPDSLQPYDSAKVENNKINATYNPIPDGRFCVSKIGVVILNSAKPI